MNAWDVAGEQLIAQKTTNVTFRYNFETKFHLLRIYYISSIFYVGLIAENFNDRTITVVLCNNDNSSLFLYQSTVCYKLSTIVHYGEKFLTLDKKTNLKSQSNFCYLLYKEK